MSPHQANRLSSLSDEVSTLNFYDFHCFSAFARIYLRALESNRFQMAPCEVCDHTIIVVYQDRWCPG